MKQAVQTKRKKHYTAPVIEINYIDMEEGIATGSKNPIPFFPTQEHPSIEDWKEGGNMGEGTFVI